MSIEAYRQAILANDQAHWQSFVDADREGKLTKEKIQEIAAEATMWLQHLDGIHRSDQMKSQV